MTSSCRECCRRALRGCLRIPGCRSICYKCVLPICYSGNESDEEKDDKDEGYASYGGIPSERQSPVNEHLKEKVQNADYENMQSAEVGYENDDVIKLHTETENCSTEKLRLPVNDKEVQTGVARNTSTELECRTYVNVSEKNSQNTNICDSSISRNEIVERENIITPYMNTEDIAVTDSSENNRKQGIGHGDNNDITLHKLDVEPSSMSCVTDDASSVSETEQLIRKKDNEFDKSVPSRSTMIDSPTKRQTLVLLETDL